MIRAFLFFLCFSAPAQAERLVIFAAASLKGPLDGIVAEWEAVSGHRAAVSYGSSGAMARQIAAGAPAEVFLSANPAWAEWVAEGRETVSFAGNRMVLVAPAPGTLALTPEALDAALGEGRLAIGITRAVPAGAYGRAGLETLGLWGGVADRLAETDSVRAALALVTRGAVPLGLVYASDAMAEPSVHVVAALPEESHPAIRYVLVTLRDTDAAVSFAAFLTGPQAGAALAEAGFLPPPEP